VLAAVAVALSKGKSQQLDKTGVMIKPYVPAA
jgi:hypothetical protein